MKASWAITYEAQFSQIRDLHRKIENCKVFHFTLLLARICKNYGKLHFAPLLPVLGKTRFFLEDKRPSLFSISRFLLLCEISAKTDRWTNKHEFIGPPLKVSKYGDKTMININPFHATGLF